MPTPKLIATPEPPSSDTPTDTPGTPNSAITSLSTLSTTAIKDGHRGNTLPNFSHGYHQRNSSNNLEAERADRISRLAGLERISAARFNQNQTHYGAGASPGSIVIGSSVSHYFDQNGNPIYATKMSTVGSASATESFGERATTWASGSLRGDEDYISVGTVEDRDRFSTSALGEDLDRDNDDMSDNQSLVGFGEGAGSTGSGPIYIRNRAITSQNTNGSGIPICIDTERQKREAKNIDGITCENSGNGLSENIRRTEGRDHTERILREKKGYCANGRSYGLTEESGTGLGKFAPGQKKSK